jgi:hypothetical protein
MYIFYNTPQCSDRDIRQLFVLANITGWVRVENDDIISNADEIMLVKDAYVNNLTLMKALKCIDPNGTSYIIYNNVNSVDPRNTTVIKNSLKKILTEIYGEVGVNMIKQELIKPEPKNCDCASANCDCKRKKYLKYKSKYLKLKKNKQSNI